MQQAPSLLIVVVPVVPITCRFGSVRRASEPVFSPPTLAHHPRALFRTSEHNSGFGFSASVVQNRVGFQLSFANKIFLDRGHGPVPSICVGLHVVIG